VVTFLDLLSGRDDHGRDSSGERAGNIARPAAPLDAAAGQAWVALRARARLQLVAVRPELLVEQRPAAQQRRPEPRHHQATRR
jgi:hypothetical protein